MIKQLRYAGDQLRAAWDNYCQVYSSIQACHDRGKPHTYDSPLELTRLLDIELAFMSSLGPKIREIKQTISRAHDYASLQAPINSLPPEILIRVFHFVLAEPCGIQLLSPDYPGYHPSRYPDYLAQVCALWRRIALSSHSLWCHIDLSPFELYCDGLLTRAWTHVERVGNLPIELHIGGDEYDPSEPTPYIHSGLCAFLLMISSRVKTLELSIPDAFWCFHRTAFHALFSGQHSNLTKLVIHSDGNHYHSFIFAKADDADESDEEYEPFKLNISVSWLESGFAALTVLHLRDVFPVWSSKAYHGLVDLRLLSTAKWSRIQETEFVTILDSSPSLRILHFGLEIHNAAPVTAKVTPVRLQDLRVLKIFQGGSGYQGRYLCPGSVLRLLAPGSKPLRLCLSGEYEPENSLEIELERFFARSRVTRFCAQHIFLPVRSLLRHAVHLESVLLHGFGSYNGVGTPPTLSTHLQVNDLALLPRLRSLDITGSTLFEHELRLLLECCPTGITLSSSEVKPDNNDGFSPIAEEERLEAFPTVRVSDHILYPWEDPTNDWDILD